MNSFHERLTNAVQKYGPLCVGLDPRIENIPSAIRNRHTSTAAAYEEFCLAVLDLVRPFAGVVKPQAAFFEQAGPDGLKVLQTIQHRARTLGYLTIFDAKRGDIASTATAYAEAAFAPAVWHADAVTVNPYLGADAVEPFIVKAREVNGGVIVLVRTSNPGGGLFQNLPSSGQPLYRHVAEAVNLWNDGRGDVGAVVGATHPDELRELRAAMPGIWFLVPGYGAQGGTAADVRAAYPHAIVNSSRGITFPFKPEDSDWQKQIENAARRAQADLS
jgi:orotidine-5'-phosphate decarboxylase